MGWKNKKGSALAPKTAHPCGHRIFKVPLGSSTCALPKLAQPVPTRAHMHMRASNNTHMVVIVVAALEDPIASRAARQLGVPIKTPHLVPFNRNMWGLIGWLSPLKGLETASSTPA